MSGKFDYHDARPSSRDLSEYIASALRENERMTKAELRRELGENAQTISRNLRDMIEDGVVACECLRAGEVYYFMRDGQ